MNELTLTAVGDSFSASHSRLLFRMRLPDNGKSVRGMLIGNAEMIPFSLRHYF